MTAGATTGSDPNFRVATAIDSDRKATVPTVCDVGPADRNRRTNTASTSTPQTAPKAIPSTTHRGSGSCHW